MTEFVIEDSREYAEYSTIVSYEPDDFMICHPTTGERIVGIDLSTGEVTLYKPVSEASQAFWDAVKKIIALESKL